MATQQSPTTRLNEIYNELTNGLALMDERILDRVALAMFKLERLVNEVNEGEALHTFEEMNREAIPKHLRKP